MPSLKFLNILAPALLLGCVGSRNGDPPAAPVPIQIRRFAVEPPVIKPGATAFLVADYAAGHGEIDHGVGPVHSGVPILVSPRTEITYTLTVKQGDRGEVKRSVTLRVDPPANDFKRD